MTEWAHCQRQVAFFLLSSDMPLPFSSGEEPEPKFSTAKEKSSIIIEKQEEGNENKDISTTSGENQSMLETAPMRVSNN